MRYIHLLWSNLIGQNVTTMVQICIYNCLLQLVYWGLTQAYPQLLYVTHYTATTFPTAFNVYLSKLPL